MRFGPMTPQHLDNLVPELQARQIPFEIWNDSETGFQELAQSPSNTVALAEFRTRTYLAQHFYFEVSDEYCQANRQVVAWIQEQVTGDPDQVVTGHELSEDGHDEQVLYQEVQEEKSRKRFWAGFLFILMTSIWLFVVLRKHGIL